MLKRMVRRHLYTLVTQGIDIIIRKKRGKLMIEEVVKLETGEVVSQKITEIPPTFGLANICGVYEEKEVDWMDSIEIQDKK